MRLISFEYKGEWLAQTSGVLFPQGIQEDLYGLSRSPTCVGISTIHFVYQYETKAKMQIELRSSCALPQGQNYFSVYDIAKGMSVFTDAICLLTESLSDQGGGQVDSFQIIENDGDSITVRIDFVNRCQL